MAKQPDTDKHLPSSLVFVYNADSGMFNTLTDIAHKVFSPQTYACNLCAISHSYFNERDEWKEFIGGLGTECEFLHRDEFEEKYKIKNESYPVIYLNNDNNLTVCLDTKSINECDSMMKLKDKITQLI